MEGNSDVIHRVAESKYFDRKANIFGLDYYDRDSRGEDDFSRKLVWFYVYGDDEIQEEMKEQTQQLFDQLFEQDDVEWDLVTLYPTNTRGGVNIHLRDIFQDITDETDADYEQALFRNRNVEESHEIDSIRKKVLNLEDSIDIVEDIEGKNIVVVDYVTLSGTSMLHATQELYDAGANRVACICLGLSLDHKGGDRVLDGNISASEIINETEKSEESS